MIIENVIAFRQCTEPEIFFVCLVSFHILDDRFTIESYQEQILKQSSLIVNLMV